MSEKTSSKPFRPLVLASTSAYRRDLLYRLRLPFDLAAPSVDETPLVDEAPAATALRLAEAKARDVASRYSHALVIGSDQVADADGRALSKPVDHDDAVAQLLMLSGRTIVFHTGVALIDAASGRCQRARVDVTTALRELSPEQIERYLRADQPYDCAGSLKAETLGIALCERIASDDPTALIGLPLITLVTFLAAEGVDVLACASPAQ